MTYGYDEATAVIGPLSPTVQAGSYDLCKSHAQSVTVPVGWQMVRLQTEFEDAPPSPDDLFALADAIREASKKDVPPPQPAKREVRRPAPEPPRRRIKPTFSVIDGGDAQDEAAGDRQAQLGAVSAQSGD